MGAMRSWVTDYHGIKLWVKYSHVNSLLGNFKYTPIEQLSYYIVDKYISKQHKEA